MKLAVSQACSLSSPLPTCFEDYAAGDCLAIEVWITSLEQFIQAESLDAFRALRTQHQVHTPVASYQGGLLASQGEERAAAWDLFERRLQLCRDLDIPLLVVACDVPQPLDAQVVDRVQVSLHQAVETAKSCGMRLALEFQVGSAFGNNLQTANALVEQVDQPELGLCLDLFHFMLGPSKEQDLAEIRAERLFHVQVSDLAGTPREFASDKERILPGDGDFPVISLLQHLRQIGYSGHISLELLNPQLWMVPARQMGEIGMAALRGVLHAAQESGPTPGADSS